MHFLLFYDYVENIIERREPYREAHLALAKEHVERGELILAGVFTDPLDGATLLFKTDDRRNIENYVQRDPYVANGLVSEWRIRECKIVLGSAIEHIV